MARVGAQGGEAQSGERNRRIAASSVESACGFGVDAAIKEDFRRGRGQRCRGPARGWERERLGLRSGKRRDHHEESILIRFGEGAGRGPSKVSTMIIGPPQHGHRCAGEGGSVSLLALAGALWGEILGAAGAWRGG